MSLVVEAAQADPPPSGMPPEANVVSRDMDGPPHAGVRVETLGEKLVAYHQELVLAARASGAATLVREVPRSASGWSLSASRSSLWGCSRGRHRAGDAAVCKRRLLGRRDRQHQQLVAGSLGDSDTLVLLINGATSPNRAMTVRRAWWRAMRGSVGTRSRDGHLYVREKWFEQGSE